VHLVGFYCKDYIKMHCPLIVKKKKKKKKNGGARGKGVYEY